MKVVQTLACLSLACLPAANAIASAVLGIDLGTENIKATLVKPGVPLDIVLTKDSKRKETAAIAFKAAAAGAIVNSSTSDQFPDRVYGSDAVALSARFPKDVYASLKGLVGHVSPDAYQTLHPELQLVSINGTTGFQSASFTTDEPAFFVEELLAMQLKNVRSNANAMGGKGFSVTDAVITVPAFYTARERRVVLVAAELAGLRVLALVSDGLAVALNFATPRTFPPVNATSKPELHLIYDMGAGSTTATLVKFFSQSVKDVGKFNKTVQVAQVLATAWDTTLGGDVLNGAVVKDMVENFQEKSGQDVTKHGRAMSKLLKEAQRIRQVLSANAETSAFFEGFYDDQDFKYTLTRADFEKLTLSYVERVKLPITEALKSAGVKIADLDSLILHGGTVRTPFVQKELESLMGGTEKVRTNVNSDEAAVFGAGFKAATISPSFRVKEITALENAVFPVSIVHADRVEEVFSPNSTLGTEEALVFPATADLDLSFQQQDSLIARITTYNLTGATAVLMNRSGCDIDNISTNLTVRLDPSTGFPDVVLGAVSCLPLETERKGVVDGVKGLFGFGKKEESSETTTTSANSTSTSVKAAEATGKAPKRISVNLNITNTPIEIPVESQLGRIRKRLAAFDASDRSRVLRDETFNTLEGYAYKIRDTLAEETFVHVSTSAQREAIENMAGEISGWLYGDGAGATRDALKAKLDEIRRLVSPIEKRRKEAASRPAAVTALRDAIQQADTMLDVMKQQQEASEIVKSLSPDENLEETKTTTSTVPIETTKLSEEEIQSVVDMRDAADNWLNKTMAEQDKLQPTDDPIVLTSAVQAKGRELGELVTKMIMKQMKAPRAKPKTKRAKPTTSTTGKTSSTEVPANEGGEWAEPSDAPDAPKMPTAEEQQEMHKIQEQIDRSLAADKASKTGKKSSKSSAKTSKTRSTTRTAKATSTSKSQASPSSSQGKTKTTSATDHDEL